MKEHEAFEPFLDRVLLRPVDREKLRPYGDHGLVVPNIAKPGEESQGYGRVISVGPGYYSNNGEFVPTKIKIGDLAMYNTKIGVPIFFNGEQLWLLYEREIHGIIVKKEIKDSDTYW